MTLSRPAGMSARRTALIGGLMVATGPLSLTFYAPALPTIVDDLGTTDASIKLTISVYFAAFAIAQLICGPLSDRFGRRPIGLIFFAIYVLGSLLCSFAPTLEMLYLGRFIQGFGVSAGVALSRAMVRDQFLGSEAIRILTLINLILTITPAVAPTLGSFILVFGSWHHMFMVMAGFGLAIVALLSTSARETLSDDKRVPLTPSVMLRNYGTLLRSPDFMFPSVLLALSFGGFHGFTTLLPFILMDGMGLTPFEFAMVTLIQTGAFVLGNVLASMLAMRLGGTRLVAVAMVFMGLSGAGFANLPLFFPDSITAIMIPVSLWMIGLAFLSPSATTAAMAGFGHMAGSAGALGGFLQIGGGFLGSLSASMLFDDAHTALVVQLPIVTALVILTAWADRLRKRRT